MDLSKASAPTSSESSSSGGGDGSRNTTSPSSQMLSSAPATEKLLSMFGPPSSPTSTATTISSSSSLAPSYSPRPSSYTVPSHCRNITPDGRPATWEIGIPANGAATASSLSSRRNMKVEAPRTTTTITGDGNNKNNNNNNKAPSISVRAQNLKSNVARWVRVKTGQSIELPLAKFLYDKQDHEIYTVVVPKTVRQGKKFLLQLPCGLKALVPCPEYIQPGQEVKFCISGESLRYHREKKRKDQEDFEKMREYDLQRRRSRQVITVSEKDIHINLAPIRAQLRRLGSNSWRAGKRQDNSGDHDEEIVFTDGGEPSLLLEKCLLDDDYEQAREDETKQSTLRNETFTII